MLTGHPKFIKKTFEKNKNLYEGIANLAKSHACTTGQLALAWLLHQGDDVVPIPGLLKKNMEENLNSLKVRLTKLDLH
eukprot:Gb_10574 [translate_table: standard]